MRALVTGGAGFIGSHLVDRLVADGPDVIVLDSLDPQVHDGTPAYLNDEASSSEATFATAISFVHASRASIGSFTSPLRSASGSRTRGRQSCSRTAGRAGTWST
jgi:nucleoside-diphosphate-sugar epimerase